MPEYLVEAYIAQVADAAGAEAGTQYAETVSLAAERITEEGRYVRLRRWILIPEDETGFYLFEGQSEEAVREAATRGGLPFQRVVEAVSDWKRKEDIQ